MTRLVFAVFLAWLLTGCLTTAHADLYYDVVMADNPVAYWRLNETSGSTIFDSASGHDGTLSGVMTLNQPGAIRTPDSDPAIVFNGGYGYVPYAADLDGSTFSVECWARLDGGAGTWRAPMMYRWVRPNTAPNHKCFGYNLYVNPSDDRWEFWIGRGETGSGFASVKGPEAIYGKWTHLVGTYDGSIMRFYVDGELAASSTQTYGILPTDASLFYIAGTPRFIGAVDEMAVYNYALTADQVLTHYESIPEPSSLALASLGLLGFALVGRRRWRSRPRLV